MTKALQMRVLGSGSYETRLDSWLGCSVVAGNPLWLYSHSKKIVMEVWERCEDDSVAATQPAAGRTGACQHIMLAVPVCCMQLWLCSAAVVCGGMQACASFPRHPPSHTYLCGYSGCRGLTAHSAAHCVPTLCCRPCGSVEARGQEGCHVCCSCTCEGSMCGMEYYQQSSMVQLLIAWMWCTLHTGRFVWRVAGRSPAPSQSLEAHPGMG
jgi:hypothetical protein